MRPSLLLATLSFLLVLGACAPSASPADTVTVPAAPGPTAAARAAQIVAYTFTPASPHAFAFSETLSDLSSADPSNRGVIDVELEYVADFRQHGYYGLLILARPYYDGVPTSLSSYDLPSLTTQSSGTVRRQLALDASNPTGAFGADGRAESHNEINQIRLTILGFRPLDSAPPGQAPPPLWQVLADPLHGFVEIDVLDDTLVTVDYRLTKSFERSK